MNVQIKLADTNEAHIIKNLYPLYLHDLSDHYGLTDGPALNRHGIFEDSQEIELWLINTRCRMFGGRNRDACILF